MSRANFDTSTYEEIDIMWSAGQPIKKPESTAICFMQHEPSFATFVSGMGIIGDREPIARIYSRHLCVEPYNHIPEVMEPCWMLYEVDDTFVLRLTNWMPPVSPDDTTNWLFSYPAIRDMTCLLIDLGVNKFFSMSTLYMPSEIVQPAQGTDSMLIYDFMNEAILGGNFRGWVGEGELALTTPSWLFNYMFAKIMHDVDALSMLCIVKTDTTGMDETAIQHFVDYYESVHQLTCNQRKMDEIRSILISLDEDGNFTSPFDIDPNDSGGFHI